MVNIDKIIKTNKWLKTTSLNIEQNKIYKLIVCILDTVSYNKFQLTSTLHKDNLSAPLLKLMTFEKADVLFSRNTIYLIFWG